MKIATIIFAMFLGACLHVEAQSQGREHPSISKEVSRFRVSKHFYQAATVYTGHSLLSKDVHRLNFTEGKISKVRMTGTPSHVISKEIARLQHSNKIPISVPIRQKSNEDEGNSKVDLSI